MREEKFTKGKWKQRQNFEHALCTKLENGSECYHNVIDIHDIDGRIICSVNYATDTPNMGWGKNETIDKWKANAQLIASSPELLEACQKLINQLSFDNSNYIDENGHNFKNNESFHFMKQAIEKATKID